MEINRPLDLNNVLTKPADTEMTEEKRINKIIRTETIRKNVILNKNLRKQMKSYESGNSNDEVEFIKQQPLHPQERLQQVTNQQLEPEAKFIKEQLLHPREWLQQKVVQNPAEAEIEIVQVQPLYLQERMRRKLDQTVKFVKRLPLHT